MTDQEKYWLNMCKTRPNDFTIVVDNDCAFVTDATSGSLVFEFEDFGWELALTLFRYIGCNAEEA